MGPPVQPVLRRIGFDVLTTTYNVSSGWSLDGCEVGEAVEDLSGLASFVRIFNYHSKGASLSSNHIGLRSLYKLSVGKVYI